MNRVPPKIVREILRKEVNFGCPIEGCGSPYLEYHHFDPTWKEKQHHDPKGMIALCNEHHPKADGGAWTKEQFREIKNKPFLQNGELLGKFDWLRQDILVMAGMIIFNPKVIIEIGDEKVVWMGKDANGYYRLNMAIKNSEGNLLLEIVDNDWIVNHEEMIDVVCPPSGKELSLISKDNKTKLAIRFDDVSIDEFSARLFSIEDKTVEFAKKHLSEQRKSFIEFLKSKGSSKMEIEKEMAFVVEREALSLQYLEQSKGHQTASILKAIGNPQRVTTCTVNASIDYRGKKFEIKEGVFASKQATFYGCFVKGSNVVYSFGKDSLGIGKNF